MFSALLLKFSSDALNGIPYQPPGIDLLTRQTSPAQSLTPAVFHILLLALADGEKHGYSIMKEAESQTGGKIKMGPGTLYGSIKRMLSAWFVEEAEERPDPALDDERRRYYRLNSLGPIALSAENQRLEQAI